MYYEQPHSTGEHIDHTSHPTTTQQAHIQEIRTVTQLAHQYEMQSTTPAPQHYEMQSTAEAPHEYEMQNGAHLGHVYNTGNVERPSTAGENFPYTYTYEAHEV